VIIGSGVSEGTNRLLDTLPVARRGRLLAAMSHVRLEPGTVLFQPRQHIGMVDFPRTCVVSLVTPFYDGSAVEVASIGSEGIVGVPLGGALEVRAVCSVGGWVDRLHATTFSDEVERDVDLHDVVEDYVRAVFNQLSQAVACNRLHSTAQRLARWLLASGDHLATGEFAITHQLLGQLLGSSESTVNRCSLDLQATGNINSSNGLITIIDRPALEAVACECYSVIKTELDGVIRRAAIRFRGARPLSLRD
jgi:Crp-like helix-turn-helix domain